MRIPDRLNFSQRRGLEATRAIFTDKNGGTPLQHLEAIALEEKRSKHEALILDVAQRLARDGDPKAAAMAIIESFFAPPVPQGRGDDSDPAEAMRAAFAAIGPTSGTEIGKRTVDEILRAAKVLELAVQMNSELIETVEGASGLLVTLSKRHPELANAVRRLRQAAQAAGTMDDGTSENRYEDEEATRAAMHGLPLHGQEYAAIFATGLDFVSEHRALLAARSTSLSAERYVRVNLERHLRRTN